MSIDQFDKLEIRCPRLGGEVNFKYCRSEEAPFCPRIVICWAERIDIANFLNENYTPEQIHSALNKPKSNKLDQILRAMEKAKT